MITTHAIPGLPPADFRAPEAPERIARLQRRQPALADEVIALCKLAADPDLALAGVERYADAADGLPSERDLLEALTLLCGGSRMAAQLLARAERSLRRLLLRGMRRLAVDDVPGFYRLLRRVRAREVLRIILRDLRRARMKEVTGELSSLATACVDAAIRFHDRRLRERHGCPEGLEEREPGAGFCALAMGKLGARELNFSSDIDLIYVYSHDGQTSGARPLDHFTYYSKLSEAVTEAIAKATEDGIVFRVDLNLRPDGRSGPLVNSIRAAA